MDQSILHSKHFDIAEDLLFSPEIILLTGSSNLKERDLIPGAFYNRKVERNCMRHHNGINTLLDLLKRLFSLSEEKDPQVSCIKAHHQLRLEARARCLKSSG
jgi:hypothetical protein